MIPMLLHGAVVLRITEESLYPFEVWLQIQIESGTLYLDGVEYTNARDIPDDSVNKLYSTSYQDTLGIIYEQDILPTYTADS